MAQCVPFSEPFCRFIDPRLSQRGLTWGNQVELLVDGQAAFGAMLNEIASARKLIRLCIYMFKADDLGWEFARALAAKARQGVDVAVSYDWVGCLGGGSDHFRYMRRAGVRAHVVNPLIPQRVIHLWHPNTRDHRKILVVDDEVGFIGGMNIAREYSGQAQDADHWHDLAMRVRGPAARFLHSLLHYSGKTGWGEPPPFAQPPGEAVPVWFMSPEPFDPARVLAKTYASLIQRAQRYVWIMNSYFLPNWPLLRAMESAARRGVDVRLVLPGPSDVPLVPLATRRWYEYLVLRGVKICERQDTVLHAKAVVADDAVSLMGSANFDPRSLYVDREIIAMVFDEAFARNLAQQFRRDFEICSQVRLEDVRGWSKRQRLAQRLAYVISPLL